MIGRTPFPELGHLSLVEVFHYYDEPVLFSCRNDRDNLFLTVLAEDEEATRTWLYAPVSRLRLQHIRGGLIDLHSAFREVEEDYVFVVREIKGAPGPSGNWLRPAELPGDFLPSEGGKLVLPDVQLAQPNPATTARQIRKDVVTFLFYFKRRYLSLAPAHLVGKTLVTLQETLDSIGQVVCGGSTIRGGIGANILRKMELGLTTTFPGSFGIELRATQEPDLFGSPQLREALDRLVEIMDATQDAERLIPMLTRIGGRVPRKYSAFLLSLMDRVERVQLQWGSPQQLEAKAVALTEGAMREAWSAIDRLEPKPELEFDVIGRLIGFHKRHKSYELLDMQEQFKYSGRVDDEVLREVTHPVIESVYMGTIRQSTTVEAGTGVEKTKYRLMHLSTPTEHGDPRDLA